ncbi:transcriptional regulator, TetR family [Desulfuromonas soudanensis]|uniref:Transcriptional regulator, TetR family n=1 Tax=Desulfuromonas soudanensis TaxID=1603606 RepID=A0A0M3QF94_9BACT|nr:TetR/AcrR family transcriptional regulator [Desulfuromonas soudanensis]ALC15683.1 transcriptional regulator, TetR family [Desulfuromonas soudanensis]
MTQTEKRSEILRSALVLISQKGFHGAPMSMIADQAQVAMGTIYRCFESKESLIHELHRELESRFQTAIMQDFPSGEPLRERFLHVSRVFVRYSLASPTDFCFLEQFYNSPFGVSYRRDRILGNNDTGVLQKLLDEARKDGMLKPLPHTVLCALIFGPLFCLVRDHIFNFIELDQKLVDACLEATWDAIRL